MFSHVLVVNGKGPNDYVDIIIIAKGLMSFERWLAIMHKSYSHASYIGQHVFMWLKWP